MGAYQFGQFFGSSILAWLLVLLSFWFVRLVTKRWPNPVVQHVLAYLLACFLAVATSFIFDQDGKPSSVHVYLVIWIMVFGIVRTLKELRKVSKVVEVASDKSVEVAADNSDETGFSLRSKPTTTTALKDKPKRDSVPGSLAYAAAFVAAYALVKSWPPTFLKALGVERQMAEDICKGAKYEDLCKQIYLEAYKTCSSDMKVGPRNECVQRFLIKYPSRPKDVENVFAVLDKDAAVGWTIGNTPSGVYQCEGLNGTTNAVNRRNLAVLDGQEMARVGEGFLPVFSVHEVCEIYVSRIKAKPISFSVQAVAGESVCVQGSTFPTVRQIMLGTKKPKKVEVDNGELLAFELPEEGSTVVVTTTREGCEMALKQLK